MYYFISYTLFDVLNTQFRKKKLSIADFAIVARDGLFWQCYWTLLLIFDSKKNGHFLFYSLKVLWQSVFDTAHGASNSLGVDVFK